MNIVLLSGGSGKRLWPLSNDIRSKQFIKIFRKEDGTIKSVGSYGYYWTNELSEDDSSKAKDLIISEKGDGNEILDFYDGNRCCGLSVRPVLP